MIFFADNQILENIKFQFFQVTMDPLGSIRERKVEEETQEDVSCQGFEIDPQQLLTDERSKNNKSTLIKKFFRQDEDKSLRRTSSFMLRSQVEGGGKHVSRGF